MSIYRVEGLKAFRSYEAALAEEHAMAQCAKIEVYNLLASDLFERVTAARAKTLAAFKLVESFKA